VGGAASGFPPKCLWTRKSPSAGSTCNLDRKNPRAKGDIAHLPPEQIAAGILEKEQRIAEIIGRIQELLARSAES
jgi:hypothetical protein